MLTTRSRQGSTAPDGRYLGLKAGGPSGGTTYGDLCVWPTPPHDDNCPQADQADDEGPPAGVEQWIPDDLEQFIP